MTAARGIKGVSTVLSSTEEQLILPGGSPEELIDVRRARQINGRSRSCTPSRRRRCKINTSLGSFLSVLPSRTKLSPGATLVIALPGLPTRGTVGPLSPAKTRVPGEHTRRAEGVYIRLLLLRSFLCSLLSISGWVSSAGGGGHDAFHWPASASALVAQNTCL